MSGRPADPLATIREALALHLSMAAAGEQPTARSLKSLDDGISALAAVERLVEAARPLTHKHWEGSKEEADWRTFTEALAPFDGGEA